MPPPDTLTPSMADLQVSPLYFTAKNIPCAVVGMVSVRKRRQTAWQSQRM